MWYYNIRYYHGGSFSTNNAMVVISTISGIIGVDIALVIIFLTCGIKGLGITMIIFHVSSIVEVILDFLNSFPNRCFFQHYVFSSKL
jgi:hypothetical protein